MAQYDDKQMKLMNEEMLIRVDINDKTIGKIGKKDAHMWSNIEKGFLHSGYSVIMFNSKEEMLITQRSDAKITFPGAWTNTLCSHPHYDKPLENQGDRRLGHMHAARRRLREELNINPDSYSVEDFVPITQIYYKAPLVGGVWGEHELGWVLMLRKDLPITPDPNEVKAIRWVTREEFFGGRKPLMGN